MPLFDAPMPTLAQAGNPPGPSLLDAGLANVMARLSQPQAQPADAPATNAHAQPGAVGPQGQYVETNARHTGLAGTARDILGTIGDIFLKKLGVGAMYAPAQVVRRQAEAGQGYDTDPSTAIARMRSINPGLADTMQGQFQSQQNSESSDADKKTAVASRENFANLAAQDRRDKYRDQQIKGSAYMLKSITPDNYDRTSALWNAKLDRLGVTDDDERRLGDKYDADELQSVYGGSLSGSQGARIDQNQERIGIADRNATTGEVNSDTRRTGVDNTNQHYIRSDNQRGANAAETHDWHNKQGARADGHLAETIDDHHTKQDQGQQRIDNKAMAGLEGKTVRNKTTGAVGKIIGGKFVAN